MSSQAALDFLEKYGMSPERVSPARDAVPMAEEMERGLQGEASSFPMIPTYLSDEGEIPLGKPCVVIDAGGTNFRRALVRFTAEGVQVEQLAKWKMPGVGSPASWEDFIAFTADAIEPLMGEADSIGFCFSYQAEITPERDGRVFKIDKDTLSYVGYFGDFMCARGLIDPQNFEMRDICDTLGSCFFSNVFSVIGNNGMPMFIYDLWVSDADPITTKIDISCAKVDEHDYTKVEDTTIPAGSFVRPYLYDVQTHRLIVMVVDEDPAKEFYAELDFEKDDNFNFTVNGKDIYDVFYSIMFWG